MIIFNALQTSLSGGIGRYSYELAKAIYLKKEIKFKIVIREQDITMFDFAKQNDLIVASGINNSKDRNLYEQIKLPKLIAHMYPDALIHYPDTMAPIFSKNKVIITVHDLAFRTLKNAFTLKSTLWKKYITNLSIRKACGIIAITEFTNKEINKYYPNLKNKKVDVVYNGFNNFSEENIDVTNIRKNIIDIKKPYILTVSTISPRKNINNLIEAFNHIKNSINLNLVIAGKNGWLYEEVYELVRKLQLEERVIFTGGINDNELKYLYKNSYVFTYPSIYEGFGLPPLEAMSYGVPCVVSNVSSIPEVVGESALLFNPYDKYDISDKLLSLINNEKLRIEISENGKKRVEKFSWDKCADETIQFYKSC